jgi:hypothetical protein
MLRVSDDEAQHRCGRHNFTRYTKGYHQSAAFLLNAALLHGTALLSCFGTACEVNVAGRGACNLPGALRVAANLIEISQCVQNLYNSRSVHSDALLRIETSN